MRVPKPWFRKQSGTWYVQLDGKQHNLGADKAAAFEGARVRGYQQFPRQL